MAKRAEARAFEAGLYSLPSNYEHILNVALDVPADVSEAFGERGHVPVVGTVDDAPLVATFVPIGGGRHRLFLNGAVREAIGKGPGDQVRINVRVDLSDRMPPTPDDLAAALDAAGARHSWQSMSPSHRKQHLVFLADAKRETTRTKRIGQIVDAALRSGAGRRGR